MSNSRLDLFDKFRGRILLASFFLLFSSLLVTTKSWGQNWSLKRDQDSIQVYTAHAEGSKFKIIRADFTIRTTREKLFDKLLNADRYVDWQYNTLHSRVLERISPREIIYYNEVDAPWPVANRDLVIRLKIEETSSETFFRILTWSEPGSVAVKSGVIRVPSSKGEWKVKDSGNGRLQVRFEMQIDPGGDVPAWLVNLTSSLAPYQTFLNLKKMLE